MLPLVAGALLTYLIANTFPIVNLGIQGQTVSATLLGSILALWGEGRQLVAVLVFATTLLFPLVDLLAMLIMLLPSKRPALLWRFVLALRPWGMVEVFMLGTLVALVKLSHMAHVVPGAALWAFAVLTILMAVILAFDPRSLWDESDVDRG
jgi:paraquat-inducible protein A